MRITFSGPVNFIAGTNRISLLSIAVGLPVSIILSYPWSINSLRSTDYQNNFYYREEQWHSF